MVVGLMSGTGKMEWWRLNVAFWCARGLMRGEGALCGACASAFVIAIAIACQVMGSPPSSASPLPRLFISAITDEFRMLRGKVAEVVRTLGYEPVSMDDWPLGHGELRAWLREQIDSCAGVIHIPGLGYGAEPTVSVPELHGLPTGTPRYSYTQYEFLYAQTRGLKTWVIQPGPSCTRDVPLDRLDLPRAPGSMTAAEVAAWQTERRRLQRAWNARLKAMNHIRHQPRNDEELRKLLHTLRDHAEELRGKFGQWQECVSTVLDRVAAGQEEVKALMGESLRMQSSTREELRELKRVRKLDAQAGAIKPGRLAQARTAMIDKVRDYWIEGVLQPTLSEAARFNIGHELVPGAVVAEDYLPERDFGPQEDIAPLFEQCGRRLLILGSPGSGKTMLLLRLAEPLLRQAEADANAPIPVVLNLSSWWRDRLPLDQWMVREAAVAYRIQPHVMRRWIRDEAVIPLLDGLDEVGLGAAAREKWMGEGGAVGGAADTTSAAAAAAANPPALTATTRPDEKALSLSAVVAAEAREACLKAINTYLEASPRKVGVAICSRSSEYGELAEKLHLNCALRLQDLSETQVQEVLAAESMQGVRELEQAEPWLHEMVGNPFLLNLMSVAYRGKRPSTKATQAARQEHLMAAYVDQRLSETRGRRERDGGADAAAIREHLMWLAHNLTKAGQTVFHLESLQMTWLKSVWARCAYCVSIRLLLGWCVIVIGLGLTLLMGLLMGSLRWGGDFFQPEAAYELLEMLQDTARVSYLLVFTGIVASIQEWRTSRVARRGAWGRWLKEAALLCLLHAGLVAIFAVPLIVLVMALEAALSPEQLWALVTAMSSEQWFANGMFLLVVAVFSALVSLGCVGFVALASKLGIKSHPGLTTCSFLGVWGLLIMILVGLLGSDFIEEDIEPVVFALLLAVVSFVAGGMAWLIANDIHTSERVGWRWNWKGAVGCATLFMLSYVLGNWSDGTGTGIEVLSGVGVLGVLGGVGLGFHRASAVSMRVGPNEGVLRSVWASVKLGCVLGLLGLALAGAFSCIICGSWPWEVHDWYDKDFVDLGRWGFSILFVLGALAGGLDVPVKHYTLRVLLRISDKVPLRLAKSLEEISRVLLLRRVGGGFIFVHRYLLEYFEMLARRQRER